MTRLAARREALTNVNRTEQTTALSLGLAHLLQLSGSAVSPRAYSPQQATAPSVLTPQVWAHPALSEANSPDGGVAGAPTKMLSTSLSEPQHVTVPSVLTPQVSPPTLTEVNSPVGGVAWP